MRLKLALIVLGVFAAIVVSGASAADFDHDGGPCHETPGEALLGTCPTGHVGAEYEIEIVSEEGSGCEPYDYFEIHNSALPPGLSLTREGVISGVPTSAGSWRFWLWDRDLTAAQGGPSWCDREDKSEREFAIRIDPGLAIVNESVKRRQRRPALYRDTHGQAGHDLEPANRKRRAGVVVPGIGSASAGPRALAAGSAHRDAH